MPKMISNWIDGATKIHDNASESGPDRVRITYAQAIKMPAETVIASLDTTDRGGKCVLAKRWYRWFATADAIEACDSSTRVMRARAQSARACVSRTSFVGRDGVDILGRSFACVGDAISCVRALGESGMLAQVLAGERDAYVVAEDDLMLAGINRKTAQAAIWHMSRAA